MAKSKYPAGRFYLTEPGVDLESKVKSAGVSLPVDIVYSKDVIIHQTQPFEFLSALVENANRAVVFRLRTRDKGATVLDPDQSCQFHYEGWMPFMVLNVDEMISTIRSKAPKADIRIVKNLMVLGGQNSRFLPKDCYLRETGTAETAVAIDLESTKAKIDIKVREDAKPRFTPGFLLKRVSHKALNYVVGRRS